jgi:hypothetical protein
MSTFFEESGFAEVLKKETQRRKQVQDNEREAPKEMTFEQAFRHLGRVLSGDH